MTAYRSRDATKPVPCKVCGTFIDPKTMTFLLDGSVSCEPCVERMRLDDAEALASSGSMTNSGGCGAMLLFVLITVLWMALKSCMS